MNPNDTDDAQQDPDSTVLIPTPGGRAPSRPAPSRDVDGPRGLPLRPARSTRAGPLSTPGAGLNPLVRAANPLLDLVIPLRSVTVPPDLEALRADLMEQLRQFELAARAIPADAESLAAARYALCTLMDETIASTPWGGGVWNRHGLLVAFHNEAWGGEKFFLILQRLATDPARHANVLELMYLCLALGLQGRYRVMERGHEQLALLRERILAIIVQQRGACERDLSPQWRGQRPPPARLRGCPPWVVAAGAGALLLALQLTFGWLLNGQSDPVFAQLRALDAPQPARLASPPAAGAAVVRLAGFLAPEVAAGLVSVVDLPDRSVITLRGDGAFASGSDEVSQRVAPTLQRIGDALGTVPGRVIVVGHTDDTLPTLSARLPSNFDLSKARAGKVAALLAERAGPAGRYSAEGRGATEPLVPNDGAANRARNRRVDIVLMTPPQPR